ncbi:hypothetical protein AOLI_G00269220 [Acnodon oligacanthus]
MATAEFFIVDDGATLMGRDLMSLLQLQIAGNRVLPPDKCHAPPAPEPLFECTAMNAVIEELNRLLAAGVIEQINASAWVSPIVITQRKLGRIHMCVDLCEPNKAAIVDSFPLPHMDELLSSLKGSIVFSTIDLASAYCQVPLHEDSQKMMSIILADLPGADHYIGDVRSMDDGMSAHDKTLQAVLHRLESAGLQLNHEKCQFRQSSLPFLGHTVSANDILPDDTHTLTPMDAAVLRSFLGLLSWSLSAADLDFASAECSELSKLQAQIAQGWPPSPRLATSFDWNLLSRTTSYSTALA